MNLFAVFQIKVNSLGANIKRLNSKFLDARLQPKSCKDNSRRVTINFRLVSQKLLVQHTVFYCSRAQVEEIHQPLGEMPRDLRL